jgi:CRP-like cAMP-binding protein
MSELPALLQRELAKRASQPFAKGALLVAPESRENRVWYLGAGLVRLYSLGGDGRERNHGFHGPHEWVHGRLASSDRPDCCERAAFGVEALQPTRATALGIDELEAWGQADPAVARFLLTSLMALNVQRLERETTLLTQSPEQRYRDLLERHPRVLESVPLQQIAAWLGITPVALSRIRRRMRESGA